MLINEIPTMANYNYIDVSKNYLYSEILLAIRYQVGPYVTRSHRFKVILT